MNWLGGLLALWRTGIPEGLTWEQRRSLFRYAKRFGFRSGFGSFQLRKALGGPDLTLGESLLRRIADRPLVFIASYHKTGTRSVHEYLESLGLRGLHYPVFNNCGIDYPDILTPYVGRPERCVAALAPVLARFDFFGDVPFPGLYESFAETFPRSRFLLIERDPGRWWESLIRHWDLTGRDRVLECLEAIQYGVPVGTVVTPSDRDAWIRKYLDHQVAVTRAFEGTDRLLRVDLSDPEINRSLSSFLGIAEAPPFPHVREGAIHRKLARGR